LKLAVIEPYQFSGIARTEFWNSTIAVRVVAESLTISDKTLDSSDSPPWVENRPAQLSYSEGVVVWKKSPPTDSAGNQIDDTHFLLLDMEIVAQLVQRFPENRPRYSL
jgi:hypothetical protein